MIPITAWHQFISGFRQNRGQPHGTYRAWRLLAPLRGPSTIVSLRPWNSDWSTAAEQIFLCSNGEPIRINVYAYSWGAGYGFIKLAEALHERGLNVQAAVLSDAVYRSRLISFRWLAFCRSPTIRVPANVKEVWWFRQFHSRLRGHDVIAQDSEVTLVHPPVVMPYDHYHMDDSARWHAKICDVAGGLDGDGLT